MEKVKKNKWLKITLISLAGLIIAIGAGFYIYVSDYYHADDTAITAISGSTAHVEENLTILSPSTKSTTGFIFYPGGKVEHTAYLPLLEQLRQQGITCVIAKMPFNLAVFDINAADKAFEALPDITSWYIGGHSLGGAMASSYASAHPKNIRGLILLGAYIYGDFPTEHSLTIYGSEDKIMNRSKITYTENVIKISGGNHAQFGNYGHQKGDGTSTISVDEQQAQTVKEIITFIKSK